MEKSRSYVLRVALTGPAIGSKSKFAVSGQRDNDRESIANAGVF